MSIKSGRRTQWNLEEDTKKFTWYLKFEEMPMNIPHVNPVRMMGGFSRAFFSPVILALHDIKIQALSDTQAYDSLCILEQINLRLVRSLIKFVFEHSKAFKTLSQQSHCAHLNNLIEARPLLGSTHNSFRSSWKSKLVSELSRVDSLILRNKAEKCTSERNMKKKEKKHEERREEESRGLNLLEIEQSICKALAHNSTDYSW